MLFCYLINLIDYLVLLYMNDECTCNMNLFKIKLQCLHVWSLGLSGWWQHCITRGVLRRCDGHVSTARIETPSSVTANPRTARQLRLCCVCALRVRVLQCHARGADGGRCAPHRCWCTALLIFDPRTRRAVRFAFEKLWFRPIPRPTPARPAGSRLAPEAATQHRHPPRFPWLVLPVE